MATKIVKRGRNARDRSSVKTAAKRNKTVSNLPATTRKSPEVPQRPPNRTNAGPYSNSNTHPPPEKSKLNIGLPSILAQSGPVVQVFGRLWGFVLIMSAILASTGFTVASALLLIKGVGRLF